MICYSTPSEHFFFIYIMVTSYISMRWGCWCFLCTRPTKGSLILISLAHWNNSPLVNKSLYLDILSFLPTDVTCLAEKQQYHFCSVAWPDRVSIPQSNTRWLLYHWCSCLTGIIKFISTYCQTVCRIEISLETHFLIYWFKLKKNNRDQLYILIINVNPTGGHLNRI